MLFNHFLSWLKFRFRNPAVSWMEVFVKKVGGFRLLVIVTKDLVLDVVVVLYPFLLTHVC